MLVGANQQQQLPTENHQKNKSLIPGGLRVYKIIAKKMNTCYD